MTFNKSNVIVSGSRSSLSEYANYTTVYPKPAMVGGKIVLTQDMINKQNVKYIIKWNFDLDDETITVPEGCLIEFDGGSFSNGTLVGNKTILVYNQEEEDVFKNVSLEGSFERSTSAIADKMDNTNGMAKIYLKKNKPLATQLTQPNTIYVIQYDFTLGEDITIPTDCVLEFDGGSISASGNNDTITGNNTGIYAGLVKTFNTDVILAGTWNVAEAYPEWFGAKGDGVTDDRVSIQKILDTFNYIVFQNKTYKISSYSTVDNNKYGLTISRDNVIVEGKALGDWNSKATKFIVDDSLELYAVLGILNSNISIKGITICGTPVSYINCDYGIACPAVKSSLTFEKVFVRFITGTSFWLNAYNVDMRGCVSSEANCGFHIFGTNVNGRNTSAVLYKCVSNSCPGNAFKMVEMTYSSFINCTADRVGFDTDNMSDDNISHVFYLESCNCIQLLNCATEISYKILKTVGYNREILVNDCMFFTSTDNIPEDFDYSTIYDISGDVKVVNTNLCRLSTSTNIFKVSTIYPISTLLVRDCVYITSINSYARYNVPCDDDRVVIENTIAGDELSIDNAYINNVSAITNARALNVNITIPRNMEFNSNVIIKNFKGLCNIFGDSTNQIIFYGDSVFTNVNEIIITSQHQSVTFYTVWGKKCLTLNNSKITFVGVNFGDFPNAGGATLLTCTNNSTVVLKDCTLTYNSGALTDIIKCSGNSKVEIYLSDKLISIDDSGAKQIALSPLS